MPHGNHQNSQRIAVRKSQGVTRILWSLPVCTKASRAWNLISKGPGPQSAWKNLNSWEIVHKEDAMIVFAKGVHCGLQESPHPWFRFPSSQLPEVKCGSGSRWSSFWHVGRGSPVAKHYILMSTSFTSSRRHFTNSRHHKKKGKGSTVRYFERAHSHIFSYRILLQ